MRRYDKVLIQNTTYRDAEAFSLELMREDG